MADSEPVVLDAPGAERYEIRVGGEVAGFIQYRLTGDRLTMFHTEIDPKWEGHGLGGRLARGALEDARDRGLQVVPSCPFVAGYIDKHPEYHDLVDA